MGNCIFQKVRKIKNLWYDCGELDKIAKCLEFERETGPKSLMNSAMVADIKCEGFFHYNNIVIELNDPHKRIQYAEQKYYHDYGYIYQLYPVSYVAGSWYNFRLCGTVKNPKISFQPQHWGEKRMKIPIIVLTEKYILEPRGWHLSWNQTFIFSFLVSVLWFCMWDYTIDFVFPNRFIISPFISFLTYLSLTNFFIRINLLETKYTWRIPTKRDRLLELHNHKMWRENIKNVHEELLFSPRLFRLGI